MIPKQKGQAIIYILLSRGDIVVLSVSLGTSVWLFYNE